MSKQSEEIKSWASRWLFLGGLLLFLLVEMSSCRKVITYSGSSKIISRETDATLADSVLVFGKVVSAIDNKSQIVNAKIWIHELPLSTYSDSNGLYRLKLAAGTYTLSCLEGGVSNEFQETMKNIPLAPNQKVEIHFLLGGRVE